MNCFILKLSLILILVLAKDSWGTTDSPSNDPDSDEKSPEDEEIFKELKLDDKDNKYYFSKNAKIVKPANKYPFMAELKYSERHVCSSVLISPTFFLTAASCIFGIKKEVSKNSSESATTPEPATTADGTLINEAFVKKFSIQIGNTKDTSKTLKVKRLIKHPSVRVDPSKGLPTDVMLVEVDEKVDISGIIQPICITKNYLDDYKNATVAGRVKVGDSKHLEEMVIKVWPFKQCQYVLKYIDTNIGTFLTCTGGAKSGKSACGGDRGAPLFVTVNNKFELIGIKGRDPSSCENTLPTLFTKVSVYRRWIKRFATDYSDTNCGNIPESNLAKDEGNIPFMASLNYKDDHICSASIISNTHILTSAKCLYKAEPGKEVSTDCDGVVTDEDLVKNFSLRVGSSGNEKYEIEKITKNPMIKMNDSEGLPLDSMLLKLKKPLQFSEKVHAICLTSDYYDKYRKADVASYGNDTKMPRSVSADVWKSLKCQKALRKSDFNEASFMSCVKSKEKNIEEEELGSPLYITNKAGKYELIGLKSSDLENQKSDRPALFSKVSNLRRWVKSNAPDYSDSKCGSSEFSLFSSKGHKTVVVVSTFWENDTHSELHNISYHTHEGEVSHSRQRRDATTDNKKLKKANFEFYKEFIKDKKSHRPEGFPKSGKYDKKFNNPDDIYPFIVTICYQKYLHSCFGVIVSPNYILASANCLFRAYKDPSSEPESAADGTVTEEEYVKDFSIIIGISGVEKKHYKVISIIKHPLMRRNTNKGYPIDAMLLQLNETMKFSDNLHSICLNTNYFENDTKGTVAKAKEEKTCGDTQLRQKDTKIWSHEECLKMIQRIDTNTGAVITCAGIKDDLCGVDDGAPLFVKRGNKFELIGLKSRNPTNCYSNLPTLFTKMSVLRRWIRKYVEGYDEKNCG